MTSVRLSAYPTKFIVASTTSHMITSTIFCDWCAALSAVSDEQVTSNGAVKLINYTLGVVPCFAALKAGVFLALSACYTALAQAAWSAHKAVAVRGRTPFQVAIFTHKDILINGLKLFELLR